MRRALSILTAGLLAGIVTTTALGESATTRPAENTGPARTYSSQLALQQRLSEFKVEGIPFAEVISMLARSSGANIYVKWARLEQAGVDRQTPVSVQLHNTTLAKTLDVVLDSVETNEINLGYYVHENVITISLSESRRTDLVTRVYDMTDLMFQIPDIAPGNIGNGSGASGGTSSGSNSNGGSQRSSSSSSSSGGRSSGMGRN